MNEGQSTDRVVVSLNGSTISNGGQLAVGSGITQVHTVTTVKPEITAADWEALRQMLAELRTLVELHAPVDTKQAAVERVDELAEAITAPQPDLNVMSYVKQWFTRHLPELAGAVTGIVVHPIVGKLVEAAGDALAFEFRRRFGSE